MSDRIKEHKRQLAAARDLLNKALDTIGDRANEQIYSDGAQWTLRELAVHLMLADKGHNGMVMHYAEGKEFIPPDYDIERYNRGSVKKHADLTLPEIRAALAESRRELLNWLDTLDDAKLDKEGRHATLKIMSVDRILSIIARHEADHARDILAMMQADTTSDSGS